MQDATPLFAKQPIFNNDIETVAYELLFRGGARNSAEFIDGDQASCHVLLHAFGQNKIQDIIGNAPAFINFTPQLLVFPPPLPPEQLVIEILETVKPDDSILESLKNLKAQGYKIALDDFFINKDTKQLLGFADIIKIDVLSLSLEKIKKYVSVLRPLGIQLLAEKIETHEMLEECKKMGFDYYQGYFLAKPKIITGIKISEGKQAVLHLLAMLFSQDVDIDKIVQAISSDPRLSYRILKLVNSTAYSVPCEIHSLTQAVTMLGLTQIRDWAAILLMTSDSDKPRELLCLSITRSKFCQLIAEKIENKKLSETVFTAATLSTFDAFMDMPMENILTQLSLSKELEHGILKKTGVIGSVLDLALLYEKAQWAKIKKHPAVLKGKISETELSNCYLDAAASANKLANEFK